MLLHSCLDVPGTAAGPLRTLDVIVAVPADSRPMLLLRARAVPAFLLGVVVGFCIYHSYLPPPELVSPSQPFSGLGVRTASPAASGPAGGGELF